MLLASLWLALASSTPPPTPPPTPPAHVPASDDARVFAAVGAGTVAAVGATAVVVLVAAQPDFGVLALMGGAVPLNAYVGGALGADWGGGDDEAAIGGALFGIGGVIVGGLTGAGLCLALSRAPDPLTVAIGAAVVGTGGAAARAWFGTSWPRPSPTLPSQHTYDKLVVEALRVLAPLAHSSLLAQPAGDE